MTEVGALKTRPPEANLAPRLSYLLSSAEAHTTTTLQVIQRYREQHWARTS